MKDFSDYKNIWVFAEQRQGKLVNVALELIGEGKKLAAEISDETRICAVLIGNGVDPLVEELYEYGADIVYVLQDLLLEQYTTDAYAKVMTDAINRYKPEIVLYEYGTHRRLHQTGYQHGELHGLSGGEDDSVFGRTGQKRSEQGPEADPPRLRRKLDGDHHYAEHQTADGDRETWSHGQKRTGKGRQRRTD